MSDHDDILLDSHWRRLQELRCERADVDVRQVEALKVFDAERSAIDTKILAIEQALSILQSAFGQPAMSRRPNIPDEMITLAAVLSPSRSKRARIGPQRYRMFHALRRSQVGMSADQVASVTGVDLKRVREQLSSDVSQGLAAEIEGGFQLTPAGHDLLDRFENYKRSKGQPLPSTQGPLKEGDGDADDETSEEGGLEG